MPSDDEALPRPTISDYARTGVDVGIAAIPFLGGPIQILLDSVLATSLNRRRDEWLDQLAQLVSALQERVEGFDLEALVNNETFISSVVEASRVAIATHRAEKLEMLKNFLVNVAIDPSRKDFFAHRYLRFIDELSPEHFLVLDYLSDPNDWFRRMGVARPPTVYGPIDEAALDAAEFPFGVDVRLVVLRDLDTQGLARTHSMPKVEMIAAGWNPLVTALGRALLLFVRSPIIVDDESP